MQGNFFYTGKKRYGFPVNKLANRGFNAAFCGKIKFQWIAQEFFENTVDMDKSYVYNKVVAPLKVQHSLYDVIAVRCFNINSIKKGD